MLHSRITLALALLITVYAIAAHGEEPIIEECVLEEVIVFAQKREQPLLEVPISISTLSGEELEAAGVYNINDISRLVPNLEVQTNINSVQRTFRIRRVGNLGNIPTFEPAVGVFMDEAFRPRSVFAMSDLFDLERVEVLRGPYLDGGAQLVLGLLVPVGDLELANGGAEPRSATLRRRIASQH